ncbi:MAG: WGR domain-containing protein [Myxococcota bacterium]
MPKPKLDKMRLPRGAAVDGLSPLDRWLRALNKTKAPVPSRTALLKLADKAPVTVGKFAAQIIEPPIADARALIKTKLLAELLEDQLRPVRHKRSLKLPYSHEPEVVFGSLHVKGDLELGRDTIVLGDLDVTGGITDAGRSLCVAGNVRAKSVGCGSGVWVGGAMHVEALCQAYGVVCCVDGTTADFLFTGIAEVFGAVRAKKSLRGRKSLEAWWGNSKVTPEVEKFERKVAATLVEDLDPRTVDEPDAGQRILKTIELCHDRIAAGKPFLAEQAASKHVSSRKRGTYPGSKGMHPIEIDGAVATNAVQGLRPLLRRLPSDELTLAPNLRQTKELAARLPTSTKDLATQVATFDDLDGALDFVRILLVEAGLETAPPRTAWAKNANLSPAGEEALLVGPLAAQGDLITNRHLVVFGDLEVAGELRIWDYTTRVFVTGSVKCGGLSVSGSLWVRGDIDASAIVAGYRSRLFAHQLRAQFVNEEVESHGIFAKVTADHLVRRASWDRNPGAVFKRLQSVLVADVLDETEESVSSEALMKRASRDKAFLLGSPARKKATKRPARKRAVAKTPTQAPHRAGKKSGTSKPTKTAAKGTQRFELRSGTSNKFWEVTVRGSSYTVKFGRIGTEGQAKTKSLDSRAAARETADKLIASKRAKGYRPAK